MKVFFDTNVLIAAFATHGACNELLTHCIARHSMYTSEFVLNELEQKLLKKIKLTKEESVVIIAFLRRNCEITPEQKIPRTSRDKDDDHILAAGLKAKVDCIITGDNDLLVLKSIEGIPILLPADFWKFEQING